MKSKFDHFLELHHQNDPLVIGNVWNVQSARIHEENGYKAIATSSAAVAETLGFRDGEDMPFDDYLFVIERISKSTSLPFSVDMEGGYGSSPERILENITRLSEMGVAGINIEDSRVIGGERSLVDADAFKSTLVEINNLLTTESIKLFINVRIDTFLLGLKEPLNETKKRVELYAGTGIHGFFLPCIENPEDIREAVSISRLPLNVMCMPNLPDFHTLRKLGVKRISSGNFLNKAVYSALNGYLDAIEEQASFNKVFNQPDQR